MPTARLRVVNPLNGPYVATMTWPDERVMETYSAWLRANSCCENTVTDRVTHLGDFARCHPGFPHVSPAHVTDWLGRPGYAPWSRVTYYSHLRSFFRFAAQAGIIDVDPMAGMRRPKPGKTVPRPLRAAQVARVMMAASPTTRAWLTLGLYAGLRAHEIAKIRGEDVDVDNLYVFGKGGQGAFLPTHPLVWALAATMPTKGWWFPSSRSSVGHILAVSVSSGTTKLFTGQGVEGSIHRCRHTFATELLRAGVNIRITQELMRHQSLASTEIYLAVDDDERRDAIRLLAA